MMRKVLPLTMVLLLVCPLAYSDTEEFLVPEASAREIVTVDLAAFSLSPFEQEPSAVLTLSGIYTQPEQSEASSQANLVLPVEPLRRRLGFALGEMMAINLFVWAIGQYPLDGEWTYINLDTMQHNLRYWFEWDPNYFNNNFISHPYHGSLYYNAGRTNGLDYWESSLLAFSGSFIWEVFMEHHRPSINDLIMTTTGGMYLGEMLFRYSSLVLDESATGFERVWREILGGLLNPVRGFNRLVFGETGTTRSSVNQLRAPVHGWIHLTGSGTSLSSDLSDAKAGGGAEFLLVYGDLFRGEDTIKPFDYFPVQFSLRKMSDKTYLNIVAYSLLAGKEISPKENQNHLVGLFQHYDFFNIEIVKLGGSTFAGGIISRFQLSPKVRLTTLAHVGWMVLGASNNEYVLEDLRDYNYGTGYAAKLDAAIDFQKFGNLLVRWGYWKIFTLEGAEGNDRLTLFQGKYMIPIWKGWGVGAQFTQYRRNSHYVDFPDVKKRLYAFRFSVSYRF
jgi:hypothetical protein